MHIRLHTLKYFSGLFALAALAACTTDSDDAGEQDTGADVYGTYVLTTLQSNDPSNLNEATDTPFNLVDELECFESTLTLMQDGTYVFSGVGLESTTDSSSGYTVYMYSCGNPHSSSGTWQISGETLRLISETFAIKGDSLVAEKDPKTELFHEVVYTRL